jgi:hypothetical protein
VTDGDVPGGTGAGGSATGGDGDEAVWLDLVARFDAPAPADEAPPWPDREDLAGPVHVTPIVPPSVPDALPREPPTNPTGLPGLPVLGGASPMPDNTIPDNIGPDTVSPDTIGPGSAGLGRLGPGGTLPGQPWPGLGAGTGPRDRTSADDPAHDHYIPPVPPPLPRLDPVTKGAWLALFGGPLYLLISTAIGATISGLAAFLAVAAFVGGFVILVLRMDNGRPPDSGSDDDGAVV